MKQNMTIIDDSKVAILISMGFDIQSANQSLVIKKNDLQGAIECLLSQK